MKSVYTYYTMFKTLTANWIGQVPSMEVSGGNDVIE